MNLQLANIGTPFTVRCCHCQRALLAGNKTHGEAVYADLDGRAFADYYCAGCASEVRVQEIRHLNSTRGQS